MVPSRVPILFPTGSLPCPADCGKSTWSDSVEDERHGKLILLFLMVGADLPVRILMFRFETVIVSYWGLLF